MPARGLAAIVLVWLSTSCASAPELCRRYVIYVDSVGGRVDSVVSYEDVCVEPVVPEPPQDRTVVV